MSYLVLARKYRPQRFEEVVDQEHVTHTLANAITANRVAHAILFSGPRGTGKTTVARILAKALNCQEGPAPIPCDRCRSCREIRAGSAVDVYEIDGASNNSVDQVRELRENIRYMPAHSRYKIYIIDEVHMLSIAAFNALLKTLEEPPAHILFMFATTEPHKIPVTILSRCQRHDFRRIGIESIRKHLETVCSREGVHVSPESLLLIAREAAGAMRDALSLLDLVLSSAEGAAAPDRVIDLLGVVDRKVVFDISGAVLDGDIPGLLDLLDHCYHRGYDMRKLYGDLVEHFRNLLMVSMSHKIENLVDLPGHEIERIKQQVQNTPASTLHQWFSLLLQEEATLRFATQPKLVMEMVFLRMCQLKPTLSLDLLIEKLDDLRISLAGAEARDSHGPPGAGGGQAPGASAPTPGPRKAPASSATEAGGAPVENADRLWKRIVDFTSEKYPLLSATLNKCVLASIEKDQVVIEVNGNDFNMKLMQRPKNQQILMKLFREFLGRRIELTLRANHERDPDKLRMKKDQENRLKQEALHHPLVAETVEMFNGKIVDVKIL